MMFLTVLNENGNSLEIKTGVRGSLYSERDNWAPKGDDHNKV